MIIYISIAAILLCIIVAGLIYWSYAPNLIKFATLPVLIGCAVFMIYIVIIKAGAPIKAYPTGEWEYINHLPLNSGKSIILWSWSKYHEDFRLHIFPYDRKTMKKLQQAMKQRSQGHRIKGKFEIDKKTGERILDTEKGTPMDNHNPVKH